MQDLTTKVKEVEEACDWFADTFKGKDEQTLASGVNMLAYRLRALMIAVEATKDGKMMEVVIVRDEMKCRDHSHWRELSFNSRGQFFVRGLTALHGPLPFGLVDLLKPMSSLDIIKAGVPPERIVEGVRRVTHALIVGESTTQPMAKA